MRKLTMLILALAVGCWTEVGPDEPAPTPLCEQGELSCAGQAVLLCSDDGNAWTRLEVCSSDELCDPDRGCRPRACVPAETDCFGNLFQRCSEAGSWSPVETCVAAAACDPALGCVPLQ